MTRWIYLPERGRSDKAKGPIRLAALVGLIRSGSLDPYVIVAPTAEFDANGLPAVMWPQVARGLAADLAALCRTWVRASARPRWPARDWWAWATAQRLVEEEPAHGWRVICALVAA